jgi:hypothetical protein
MKKTFTLLFFIVVALLTGCEDPDTPSGGSTGGGGNQTLESPDFVTFANGKFPQGWKTYTWEIDDKIGFDDSYSLRSANYPVALVFAYKTVKDTGFVEFYTRGGDIYLYIDSVMATPILFEPAEYEYDWAKWCYTFGDGRHEFKWEAEGVRKYLDAVRFYVEE